ncbi:MAG TPA: tetratricopeptide repeat protein [Pseudomonadales bacterium]|nr:tetratricopeptide repeat protein [Pseudomonadales bacterium]
MRHRLCPGPELPALLLTIGLAFGIAVGIGGCAATPVPAPEPAPPLAPPAPEPAAEPAPPAPVVYRNFPSDTLYELMLAELELRRGELDAAVDRYVTQARATRDPGVVANATRLSMMARDPQLSSELALLWAEVAPDDPEARQAAGLALVRSGDFEGALMQLEALRASGAEAGFSALAVHFGDLSAADRDALLEALDALQARWPADVDLAFARAVLLERADRPEDALAALELLGPADFGMDAVLLRGRLLEEADRPLEAVAWLKATIARGGDVDRVRYTLARLLVEIGDLEGAREQFDALLVRVGDNAEILLSLALICLELDRLDDTLDYLERLVGTGRRLDTGNYYLGITAERLDEPGTALDAWSRVGPGFEYARAQAAAARLALASDGEAAMRSYLDTQRARHEEEAVTLWLIEGQALLEAGEAAASVAALDAALAAFPGEGDLLYARAMAHEANDDLAGLEADLRALVDADPDDAMALNALGYTLADRTGRLDEAREFIERALALSPDDPAYIDSLGWLEYRAGNLDRAVELLRSAFAAFRDHEVAAHLGEALWRRGDRDEARGVWREGLQLEQPTDVLRETILRLSGPALLEQDRPDRGS